MLPHLVDAGGDMSKNWFVEYSLRDPYTNEMKRFREYSGFPSWNHPKKDIGMGKELSRNLAGK